MFLFFPNGNIKHTSLIEMHMWHISLNGFTMSSCRQKQLEQSEGRASAQRGELSAVRETHQKGEVERQLLEEERAQLKEALVRVNKEDTSYCCACAMH